MNRPPPALPDEVNLDCAATENRSVRSSVRQNQPYPRQTPRTTAARSEGFTLIEMLTVMAIVTVLIALVVPAVAPLLRSSNMNSAASMLSDEMNLARQMALSQNRDIEV